MIHIDKLLEKESRLPRAINNQVVGKIGGRRKHEQDFFHGKLFNEDYHNLFIIHF